MAYEKKDWVVTPDESTPFNYTANLATMASSIENVAGAYVYHAEGVATILDSTNFQPYSAGNTIRCTREGKYVTVTCIWGIKTAGFIEGSSNKIFAQLPVGFRPKFPFYSLQQGSTTSHYLLTIGTDGKMSAARATGTQIANYWMPIHLTFLAEL